MTPEERAAWKAAREARLRELRSIISRLEAELAAEKKAPEHPRGGRRFFGSR